MPPSFSATTFQQRCGRESTRNETAIRPIKQLLGSVLCVAFRVTRRAGDRHLGTRDRLVAVLYQAADVFSVCGVVVVPYGFNFIAVGGKNYFKVTTSCSSYDFVPQTVRIADLCTSNVGCVTRFFERDINTWFRWRPIRSLGVGNIANRRIRQEKLRTRL
jgi:hypothetical protein